MVFLHACLLICLGLRYSTLATPLTMSLSSTPEDGAVKTELLAPTPKMVQFIGRRISLDCSIRNSENYTTIWSKILSSDGASLDISNGTELCAPNSRYTLVKDSATSSIKLQIQNLQATDAGLYQCTIIRPDDFRLSNRIELEVYI